MATGETAQEPPVALFRNARWHGRCTRRPAMNATIDRIRTASLAAMLCLATSADAADGPPSRSEEVRVSGVVLRDIRFQDGRLEHLVKIQSLDDGQAPVERPQEFVVCCQSASALRAFDGAAVTVRGTIRRIGIDDRGVERFELTPTHPEITVLGRAFLVDDRAAGIEYASGMWGLGPGRVAYVPPSDAKVAELMKNSHPNNGTQLLAIDIRVALFGQPGGARVTGIKPDARFTIDGTNVRRSDWSTMTPEQRAAAQESLKFPEAIRPVYGAGTTR